MATLIADDLLLLLLDDEKGTPTSSYLDTVLGGALLLELALAEAVDVREKTSIWSSAKVVARPGAAVDDPVLQDALATVAERERSASDLVGRLGKGAKDVLAERLAERGVLARHDDRVLGLFPRTRWLPADAAHEQELRRALTAVLVQGAEPDQRTGALAALLSAVDKAPAAVDHPGVPAREVRRRAKQVAEGAWAAKAVQDAIAASTAAIMAGVTAATITTTTASG